MNDTCCLGCFSDPFLRAVMSQRGVVRTDETCLWCGCEGHPTLDLVELAAMFRKVVESLYVRHDSVPRWYEIDAMDGELLGDAMAARFADRVKDRNELATAIVNADLNIQEGDDEFSAGDTLWHLREVRGDVKYDEEHPWTVDDAPFEDRIPYYFIVLTEALRRYGHSLDPDGGCGSESAPHVRQAVEALRSEFAKHVYSLPVKTILYRARIEQAAPLGALDDVRPPPPHLARSGRVNLAGQRVLYAASTQETAIAEVRPALSDRVVVGSFVVQRKLRVLDLTNAPHHELVRFETQDTSDTNDRWSGPNAWIDHINFGNIRRKLGEMFGKPVRPSDTDQDCLPTQYIARVVQHMKLDGIAYPSSQSANLGFNYAFFSPFVAEPDELWATTVKHVHVDVHPLERVDARLTSEPEG